MSLEEYGIDRYKVTQLFQEGEVGPQGPAGTVYNGTGQIVVRESLEYTVVTPGGLIGEQVMPHTLAPNEINRFNESLYVIHTALGTGAAFPLSAMQIRFQHAPSVTDVLIKSTSGAPISGTFLSEIQADPWNKNYLYWTANQSQGWSGGTAAARINIGIDWIATGGQFVTQITISAGVTAGLSSVYMMKRESTNLA